MNNGECVVNVICNVCFNEFEIRGTLPSFRCNKCGAVYFVTHYNREKNIFEYKLANTVECYTTGYKMLKSDENGLSENFYDVRDVALTLHPVNVEASTQLKDIIKKPGLCVIMTGVNDKDNDVSALVFKSASVYITGENDIVFVVDGNGRLINSRINGDEL